MSTFSGITTALSSLIAQRQAIDVTAQNLSNVNTTGYTRQQAIMTSVVTNDTASMYTTQYSVGTGVQVSSVNRLADAFVDAQVRNATSSAAYLKSQAGASSQVETTLDGTASTSLTTQLTQLWSAFQEAASYPGQDSNKSVVLTKAKAVTDTLHSLDSSLSQQWSDTLSSAQANVTTVNATAASIADLNTKILGLSSNGQSANELIDQRDQLVTTLSGLVGATATTGADGQVEVDVGGNALVSGKDVHTLALTGATSMSEAKAGTAVSIVWTNRPTVPVSLSGGTVGGQLAALAPADSGNGGVIAEASTQLDSVAATLASTVNALHSTAVTTTGVAGGDFFSGSTASGIQVAVTSASGVALASATGGGQDGSVGRAISQLSTSTTGADSVWSSLVTTLGERVSSESSRSTVAETARTTVVAAQTSGASVDTDEETVNLLTYQRAYQAAARVMSTIDSVLDTLINRTGA